MEIEQEVFNYFAQEQYQVLKDDPSLKTVLENNSVILDKSQQSLIETGVMLAQFLIKVGKVSKFPAS